MGDAWRNGLDLVFTRADGRPVHPQVFSEAFVDRVAAAGLPRLSVHDLRHTHTTLALRAGVHPKVVRELLGRGLEWPPPQRAGGGIGRRARLRA